MIATEVDAEARALRALWTIPQITQRRPYWDGEQWSAKLEVLLHEGDTTAIDDVRRQLTAAGWDVEYVYQSPLGSPFWELVAWYPTCPVFDA